MAALRLDPGQLRTRLTLQRNAPVADGSGGFTSVWTDIATIWALVVEDRMSTAVALDGNQQTRTARIRLRQFSGIAPGMRFQTMTGTNWTIRTTTDPDGTGRYLECGVEEE